MANLNCGTAINSAAAITVALLLVGFLPVIAEAAQGNGPAQKDYSVKLLAVSESGNEGVTADLHLRIAPGTGNVFIESEPVTKLDTRISLKLAKEAACQSITSISEKCSEHDFFFRIDADASLLGGPSAGAAAAALTVAALDDSPINRSVAVTGTINSGGLIGEVGGLKHKVEAAAKGRLSVVLIPDGERYYRIDRNKTTAVIDLVEYGKSLGIDVREVSSIQEALLQLTGKDYSSKEQALEIDKRYSGVMDGLAREICGRSNELSAQASKISLPEVEDSIRSKSLPETAENATNQQELELNLTEMLGQALDAAKNLTLEGLNERGKGKFYSAASRCFSSNVKYSYLILLGENLSYTEAAQQVNQTAKDVDRFGNELPETQTLAGLQVRGSVMERLGEARELLQLSSEDLKKRDYNDAVYRLAFANERLRSARAWKTFLTQQAGNNTASPESSYNNESLRNGCIIRLQEADEHMQYLDVYLPGVLNSKDELGQVYSYLRQGDYSSCIYSASLAKAKANAMLSALTGNENLTKLVGEKLKAAEGSIARQTRNGDFPIISYSYYEYSGSLKDTDPPSALLFAEYALELSNLNVYLDNNANAAQPGEAGSGKNEPEKESTVIPAIAAAAIGFAAGLLTFAAVTSVFRKRQGKRIFIRQRKLHAPG